MWKGIFTLAEYRKANRYMESPWGKNCVVNK